MTAGIALKNLKKAYLAKIICIIIEKYVLNVWKAFKMNTMKYFHDLHMKTDVLLLACMCETFRKESINLFELDPAHKFFTPGYS